MVLIRIIIGSIWVSILLIGRGLWSPTELPTPRIYIAAEPSRVFPDAYTAQPWRPNGVGAGPRVDLHGNPIEPAVGDYRMDSRGDLYERRTPNTTISALPPPGV